MCRKSKVGLKSGKLNKITAKPAKLCKIGGETSTLGQNEINRAKIS